MPGVSSPSSPIHGFDEQGNPVRANTRRGRLFGASLERVPEESELIDSPAWDSFCPDLTPDLGDRRTPENRLSVSTQFDVSILKTPSTNSTSSNSEFFEEANMSNENIMAAYKLEVQKYVETYEEDYKNLSFDEVTSHFLSQKISDADKLKNEVRELIHNMRQIEPQESIDIPKLQEVKQGLIDFVKKGQNHLKAGETRAQKQPKPGHNMKRIRVEENIDSYLTLIEDLIKELAVCDRTVPCTDLEAKRKEEKVNLLVKRCQNHSKDCDSLISDANDIGKENLAIILDRQNISMKKQCDQVVTSMSDQKSNLGILGNQDSKVLDLKPPLFTGMSNDIDFYQFKKEFFEYLSTKNLSISQQLTLLQKTCLKGAPKAACLHFESVDEVFSYLKEHFGHPMILFQNKMQDILKFGPCTGSNIKKREWALNIKFKLKELEKLCAEHDILEELYYSPICREVQGFLPSKIREDFKESLMKKDIVINRKKEFKEFVAYLDVVIKTLTFEVHYETDTMSNNKADNKSSPSAKPTSKNAAFARSGKVIQHQNKNKANSNNGNVLGQTVAAVQFAPRPEKCPLCTGKHTHLFYCEKFIKARFKQRFKCLQENKICFRCLRLDSEVDFKNRDLWWANHEINCETDFACTELLCSGRTSNKQIHILVCSYHIKENRAKEDDFKKSLDQSQLTPGVKFFNMLTPVQPNGLQPQLDENVLPDVENPGIFMVQKIKVEGRELFMFYDSGCAGAAINDKAYKVLETTNLRKGPTPISVAAAEVIVVKGGDERFHLELNDTRKMSTLTALHMESITTPFPLWELQGAWEDIVFEHKKQKIKEPLPTIPKKIGGQEVDILVGIRYYHYFPKELFSLPCGLTVFKAKFKGSNGHQGVLGGPHKAWENAQSSSNHIGPHLFFLKEAKAYCQQSAALKSCMPMLEVEQDPIHNFDELVDTPDIEIKNDCESKHCAKHKDFVDWTIPTNWNLVDTEYTIREAESTFARSQDIGSEITYRCVRCRNCIDCRRGDILEQASLAEEVEQALIESNIFLEIENSRLVTYLPFVKNPTENLTPNRKIALKILESQINLAVKNPEIVADLEKAHGKILDKGYAVPVENLTEDERAKMESLQGCGYIIPWRFVYKEGSLSTPCRMVFDASSRTPGGESLNGILAKGPNSLGNLFIILIKFRSKSHAVTTDIAMAYNGIQIFPEHYGYQRYLWQDKLDPNNPIQEMVIKTLIYGVRPSGNITIAGFQKVGNYCLQTYPEQSAGAKALMEEAYMDDVASAQHSRAECQKVADGIVFTLGLVSMGVKAFTFSGEAPPPEVSVDGKSVGLLGYLWYPETDMISLDQRELYLGKAKRGRRPDPVVGEIGEALKKQFTRRVIQGKVAGLFDPIGLVTPITSNLKLDLNSLVKLKLDWDDPIPEIYLDQWVRNLERIQETREIKFRRTVIPMNAVSPQVELVVSVDASEKIAVSSVHARVLCQDGTYSCQLVTAKSKLITTHTVPRAELKAAKIGANLGHVVKCSFGALCSDVIHVTDSTIVLFWINQDQRPLHTAVRNGVIDIRRFSSTDSWFHIDTEFNIADLGTRKAEPKDIDFESCWQQGNPWMKLPREEMPLKTMDQIVLSGNEKREAAVEMKSADIAGIIMANLIDKVAERHSLSSYIPDPTRISWNKVFRCRAAVVRFVTNLKKAVARRKNNEVVQPGKENPMLPNQIQFTNEELGDAANYYWTKATVEVKKFSKPNDWKNDSQEKDQILYYTGRIVDGQEIEDNEGLFMDLEPLSFCNPIVDRYSPIAYAIMTYAHCGLTHHRNVAATLLESRTIAFILEGRNLAVEICSSCTVCKRYKAKLLQVEMGKVHPSRLSISPAFYYSQVDLFGPMTAICEHNHRSTVKVWGLVFKCTATTAVSVYVMQDYTSSAFVQAYTRHAARYGHSKKLFIDSGSQLMKACNELQYGLIDFVKDLESRFEVGIEFEVCPVGGHNANGMVERSILEIKKIFERVYSGLRLDILTYETAFSWISSELNNMPICLNSRYNNLGHTDLITPSRLILGRNNRRAPVGPTIISAPSRLMDQMEKVKLAWWNLWKSELLADLIPQPAKWRKNSPEPEVDDVVIFIKDGQERALGDPVWKMGKVSEVERSSDGFVRHIIIKYKNANEDKFRTTRRSIRTVAILHKESELDLVDQLNQASKKASIKFIQSFINHQGVHVLV